MNVRRVAPAAVVAAWLASWPACRRAEATGPEPGHTSAAIATAVADAAAPDPPTDAATADGLASHGRERPNARWPFGEPSAVSRYSCSSVGRSGPFHRFLADADTHVAFIDGNDWLALVNRSPQGALPPTYAPADLVDVRDGAPHTPAECESAHLCLRRDAAAALHRMLDAMRAEGLRGLVQSAYRGFGTQCWVFASWARQARGGFCEATEQSALPGHSQHQLGTTLDLFTTEWAERGAKAGQGVFRNGFGCTSGGKWLDENSWRYGFVVSYPIDPDDRKDGSRCQTRADLTVPIDPKTGYKHEPWHVRYIGDAAAAQYHDAWLASGPGTPRELTLEQWLRARRGLVGDAELPVCDGCSCDACATLADDDARSPCGRSSLRLDAAGRVLQAPVDPSIVGASAAAGADGDVIVAVTVDASPHTPTQTPVTTPAEPAYGADQTYLSLAPYAGTLPHRYDDLPGAWRVAIEPSPPTSTRWPWRASLAAPDLAATWNRANLVLPARAGQSVVRVRVRLPAGATGLRAALLCDGVEHGAREVRFP